MGVGAHRESGYRQEAGDSRGKRGRLKQLIKGCVSLLRDLDFILKQRSYRRILNQEVT